MEIENLRKKMLSEERRKERLCRIAEDLRGGRKVTDFRFDQVYPAAIRKLSDIHWSPVEVAIRAAELLAGNDGVKVLDVGSGCGKFCTVAALSCRGQFTGIEQRPHLAAIARAAASDLGATNALFIDGNMMKLDWSLFDAFYLFNPFYENIVEPIRIDGTVSHNQRQFNRYVQAVETKLEAARPGTKVVTYHGFGGSLPIGYRGILREWIGSGWLELWVKAGET